MNHLASPSASACAVPCVMSSMTTTTSRKGGMKRHRSSSSSPSASSSSSSSLMYTLDAHHSTAVELGNIGADLIVSRDAIGAMETLRDAVELLSKPVVQIRAADDESLFAYAKSNNDAIERAESRLMDARAANGGDGRAGDDQLQEDEESALLIYAEPVRLSPRAMPGHGHHRIMEEIASAFLFNLALAHHLAASEKRDGLVNSSQHRRKLLEKSLCLYEMCVSTLMKVDGSSSDCVIDGGVAHVARAVVNNSGQIFIECGDHSKGRKYFSDLESILSRSGEQSSNAEGGMDLFSFNILVASQLIAAPMA